MKGGADYRWALVADIEARVRAASTQERAAHEKRYLKSDLEHYGTSVPDLRKIEKAVLRESVPNDRGSIMQLAGDLWARPVHELRMLACDQTQAARQHPQAVPAEMIFVDQTSSSTCAVWSALFPRSPPIGASSNCPSTLSASAKAMRETTPVTRALPMRNARRESATPAVWSSGNMFSRSSSTGNRRR